MAVISSTTINDLLVWLLQPFPDAVLHQESHDYSIVLFNTHSIDVVKSLWTRLIASLSQQGLVNGVFDVPITFFGDSAAVIWITTHPVICTDSHAPLLPDLHDIQRPSRPSTLSLAIGGPSAAGKTSLIKHLSQTSIGSRLTSCVLYTTRPQRLDEVHGKDYYFVDIHDLAYYQANSMYGNFVEARGYWYWTDLSAVFLSKWLDEHSIHITTITQRHEFLALRTVLPDLQWIWLDASEDTLLQRLVGRHDDHSFESLTHNAFLSSQNIDDLIALHIWNDGIALGTVVQQVVDFIRLCERQYQ